MFIKMHQRLSSIKTRPTIVGVATVLLLLFLSSPSFSGWFGPDNKEECVEKYKDRASTYDTYESMLIGCQLVFEHKNKKYGECMLDHFEDVRSSSGTTYLAVACDILSQKEHSQSHDGAECMLRYVNKIIDEDSDMFFTNIKCDLSLEYVTTTTHGDGSKTTERKKYKK